MQLIQFRCSVAAFCSRGLSHSTHKKILDLRALLVGGDIVGSEELLSRGKFLGKRYSCLMKELFVPQKYLNKES